MITILGDGWQPLISYQLFASNATTDRQMDQTFNLDSLLIGARIPRTGHDHGDCREGVVPHGGAGGQFTFQCVLDDFIEITAQEGQQHLKTPIFTAQW